LPFHFLERQHFHRKAIYRDQGYEASFGENDGENEMERRSVLLDGAAGGTNA
jgi:hypothetical protein